jgi:rubrerythrin
VERRDFLKFSTVAAVSLAIGGGAGYFVGNESGVAATNWQGDTTDQDLKNAYAGESQAHMRYALFAAQAQSEGFNTVARLFTAISFAEQVHAGNYFKTLSQLDGAFLTHSMAGFGPGNTSKNLDLAIGGENFEVTTMYPAYKAKATQESASDAELYFSRALQAEQSHLTIYQQAKQSVDSGSDAPFQKIYVCPVCGRVVADNAPDFCPVCGTSKSQFKVY